jgi:hypothetical protein
MCSYVRSNQWHVCVCGNVCVFNVYCVQPVTNADVCVILAASNNMCVCVYLMI